MSRDRRRARLREVIASRNPTHPALGAWLAPEYPGVSTEQACWLRRGKAPREIAELLDCGSDLSRAEAHRWLTQSPLVRPLEWLCSELGLGQLRSWQVARWAQRVLRSPVEREALYREREIPGPAGTRMLARFADRLDEITEEDLVRGRKTGVHAAFASAARRLGEEYQRRMAHDHRVIGPEPPWRLPKAGSRAKPAFRWLRTPAALAAEGRELGHCVGGYAWQVERGQCFILAVDVAGQRGTAELLPSGQVVQWFGPRDGRPPKAAARALNRWLERAGLTPVGESWGRL